MKRLIEARIKNFCGYGNLKSDLWFIAMEEGHDGTLKDVLKKFKKTHGQKVFDPRPSRRWFTENSSIQPTWGKLIRILLATKYSKQHAMDKERVREFQIHRFGTKNGDHAMLDLMPLPSQSISKWFYAKLGIRYLESREAYQQQYRPLRIKLFKRLITKYKPRSVVLCSFGYLGSVWPVLAGGRFSRSAVAGTRIYYRKSGTTNYFVVPHPTARLPVSNEFWFKLGRRIRLARRGV